MNFVLVLLAFVLPGLIFGASIQLRGWTLVAAAPMLTFGVVALGVTVFDKLDLTWNLLNVALWTLALSAVMLVTSSLLMRGRRLKPVTVPSEPVDDEAVLPRSARGNLLIGAGVAAGMLVGAVTFLRGIGRLDNINQDWDAPFHGNAVRWIAESGSAAPSALRAITNVSDGTAYFYPDTYHALLALLLDRGGLAMPQLLNLAALTIVLMVPLGVAALAAAWRMPTLAVAAAAAVSTWFTAFPYDLLWRGPLWPYVAGLAMVPAVLAVARHLIVPRGLAGVIGVTVGVAGLIGLHTSLIFIITAYFILLLLAVVVRLEPIDWRVAAPSLIGTVVLGGLLAMPLLLPAVASADSVTSIIWASEATAAGGFGQMITFSPDSPFPQWWLGLPALAGIFLLVKHRRMLWMVGAFVLMGGLYAATVSLETPLIQTLTGPFYNDHWRIGALIPLAGAIAFGEFAWTVGDELSERVLSRRPNWSAAAVATAGVIAVGLVVGVLSKACYIGRNSRGLAEIYRDGPTVSRGERAAYAWLAKQVRPGEHVMNDRYDGSVWMYALAGVRPVAWTFQEPPEKSPTMLLAEHLNEFNPDGGPIGAALRTLDVRYVVIGEGFVRPDRRRGDGLRNLGTNPRFHVVYRNPEAVVYRIGDEDQVRTSGASSSG